MCVCVHVCGHVHTSAIVDQWRPEDLVQESVFLSTTWIPKPELKLSSLMERALLTEASQHPTLKIFKDDLGLFCPD